MSAENLVEKLNSNKGASNCSFSDPISPDSPDPLTTFSATQRSQDIDIFTDISVKRPLSESIGYPASKRRNYCRLSPSKESEVSADMGRRSNGKSRNEFNELKLGEWNWEEISIEVLRSTPGLSLKTPTTFAEAAKNATIRMKEREMSLMSGNVKSKRKGAAGLKPRKIFSVGSASPAPPTDSTASVKSPVLSPCSTIPPTLSPMSPLEATEEQEIAGQLLSLTVNDELNISADSFSSDPDSARNKGAIAFLDLIEGFLARQASAAEALKFERLVVEMMDIDISGKVPTPEHIATTLNENGWNMQQVASVWTVSTKVDVSQHWNDSGIEMLAGKGAISRIWDRLKTDSLTGFPKRPASDMESGSHKRQKTEVSTKLSSSCHPATPPTLEECAIDNPPYTQNSMSCPRKSNRRKVFARRKSSAGLQNKITWWFTRQTDSQETPQRSPGSPMTPEAPQPAVTPKMSKKRCRGRKKQLKGKGSDAFPETPATPEASLVPQKNPKDQDKTPNYASPVLQSKLVPKIPRRSLPNHKPPSSVAAKTTGVVPSKDAETADTLGDELLLLDRKENPGDCSTLEEQAD